MRVELYCPSCFGHASSFSVPVSDRGLYEATCPHGHAHTYCVPQQLFEVLFDYAVNAAADGYFRDAVSSWSAALERSYEFFLRVISRGTGTPDALFSTAWKEMASQSERQYGAYLAACAYALKREPGVLSNKEREFRNSVVHKGQIPTEEQTLQFGERVRLLISSDLSDLQRSAAEAVRLERLARQNSIEDLVPPTVAPVHWHPRSSIYRIAIEGAATSVQELVSRARSSRTGGRSAA